MVGLSALTSLTATSSTPFMRALYTTPNPPSPSLHFLFSDVRQMLISSLQQQTDHQASACCSCCFTLPIVLFLCCRLNAFHRQSVDPEAACHRASLCKPVQRSSSQPDSCTGFYPLPLICAPGDHLRPAALTHQITSPIAIFFPSTTSQLNALQHSQQPKVEARSDLEMSQPCASPSASCEVTSLGALPSSYWAIMPASCRSWSDGRGSAGGPPGILPPCSTVLFAAHEIMTRNK